MDHVETSGHLELGRLKAVASAHHADRLNRNLVDEIEAVGPFLPLVGFPAFTTKRKHRRGVWLNGHKS